MSIAAEELIVFLFDNPTTQDTDDEAIPIRRVPQHAFILRGRGAPVTYKTYPGADHFSIIRSADADVLAFLRERFAY